MQQSKEFKQVSHVLEMQKQKLQTLLHSRKGHLQTAAMR